MQKLNININNENWNNERKMRIYKYNYKKNGFKTIGGGKSLVATLLEASMVELGRRGITKKPYFF